MIGALWTGISGLSSQQKALDNESNNIANVNTIGFKASRISFADQMYQDRIGKGSKILDSEKLYTQGNLKLTGVNYDMALSGDGFFTVLNNRSSGSSETLYTRAGNFRMGDNGTLQDSAGNEVQGWPMTAIDNQNDVTSTNPNAKVFNEDFTKLLGSKVIKHENYVETITAKATDYASTAKSDSSTVFSGAGFKSKSAKISDIEAAITDYTNWLQKLKDEPDGLSATSIAQISEINFKTGSNGIISKDGDQIYAYINGNKISQNYIVSTATAAQKAELYAYDQALAPADRFGFANPSSVVPADIALYDQAMSRISTYKALSDKISAVPGLVASMTNETGGADDVLESGDTFNASTKLGDMLYGIIQIKSLIPGKEFTISEVSEVSGTTTSQGHFLTTTPANAGSGIGALTSSKDALSKLLTGKQQDVYTPSDLGFDGTTTQIFTFSVNIYDKELDKIVIVPNDNATIPIEKPVFINAKSIDEFIINFNANKDANGNLVSPKLTDYVEAVNINGNLVIRTKDSNYDVEFTGALEISNPIGEIQSVNISSNTQEIQTITLGSSLEEKQNVSINISNTTNGPVTFLGTVVNNTISGDTASDIRNKIINDKQTIIQNWNLQNPTKKIKDITEGTTQFPNNSFQNGTTGWDFFSSVAQAGITQIAGFTMPIDTTYPTPSPNTDSIGTNMIYSPLSIQNEQATLTSSGSSVSNGIVRGPYLVSQNAIDISKDATVTVKWSAASGGDAYDVFGYLIDENTGDSIIIMNETGNSTNGTTAQETTIAVNQDGKYKFVFVSGSYDLSGGTALGATLLVDDITINNNENNPYGTDLIITYESSVGDASAVVIPASDNATFTVTDNIVQGGLVTNSVSFLGFSLPTVNGNSIENLANTIDSNKAAIISNWNSIASNKQIDSITVDTSNTSSPSVIITYANTEGDVPSLNMNNNNGAIFSEVETVKGATSTSSVSFLGTIIPNTTIGDTIDDIKQKIISSKNILINNWNINNPNNEISDIQNGTLANNLNIIYKDSEGDISEVLTSISNNILFGTSIEIRKAILAGDAPFISLDKNADYSGRAGAGAEFIEIINKVDQTASKGSLQLRLDTLGISDTAFGEFSVDSTGLITMKQDGAEFAIGQVAIAVFNNNQGLNPIGDNLLAKTNNSGEPIYNLNNAKTAKIECKTLELSTADLSESLVNLMVFQRAFEANAKSITTSDELLNTLINLKK